MNADTAEWATRGRASRVRTAHVVAVTIALGLGLGAWYAVRHGDAFKKLGDRSALGPSVGSWYSSFPEEHGLSGSTLIEGAAALRKNLPTRDCLVVAMDGAVVHEEYYNGATMNTAFDVGKIGKLATALVIGVAAQRHDLELDDSVIEYLNRATPHGGDTPPTWNAHYWEGLTVRQLLAQVSSDGSEEPGTVFSDDGKMNDEKTSPLMRLNSVLRGATGRRPVDFAEAHLAEPIGLKNFFATGSGANGDISFVGGQMASCRDIARFGQLIVNEGKWRLADGTTKQLVSPSIIRALQKPNYPLATQHFGLAGFVYNVKAVKMPKVETSKAEQVSGLGADCPASDGPVLEEDEPEYDVLFNVGDLGSMLVTIPSKRAIVVSLGTTWASPPQCPAASQAINQAKLPESERSVLPRNDLFAVQRTWKFIKLIVEPELMRELTHKRGGLAADRKPNYESVWHSLHHKQEESRQLVPLTDVPDLGQAQDSHNDKMEALVNSIQQDQIDQSKASTAAAKGAEQTWTADDTQRYSGTCSCSCAPHLKIGQCFNVRNSRSNKCDDLNLRRHGARFCPELGIVNSCDDDEAIKIKASQYGTSDKYTSENISAMIQNDHGKLTLTNKQINDIEQDAGDIAHSVFTCKVEQGCGEDVVSSRFWSTKDGRYGTNMYALKCAPTGFSQCTFTPDAECAFDDVKKPLTNVSIVQGESEALVEMPTEGWILQSEESATNGELGKDVSYFQLHLPGRDETVQLREDDEWRYFSVIAVMGAGAIVLGAMLVAIAKGKFSAEDESRERLVGDDSGSKYMEDV